MDRYIIAAEPEAARRQIEEILELRVKEWRLAGVTRDANGVGALEYRVRLRKSVPVDSGSSSGAAGASAQRAKYSRNISSV